MAVASIFFSPFKASRAALRGTTLYLSLASIFVAQAAGP